MTTLFQPQNKTLLYVGIYLLIVALALLLFGCADQKDPLPALDEQLQGAWRKEAGIFQTNYNFHGGAVDSYTTFSGQEIYQNNYAYSTKDDTLTMVDLVSREKFVYSVEFPTDSTCVWGGDDGLNYFLKRL